MPEPNNLNVVKAANGYVITYTVNKEERTEIAASTDELINKLNTLYPTEKKDAT